MLEQLIQLDQRIIVLINNWHNSFFDVFMWLATSTTTWIPFFASLLWLMLKNKKQQAIVLLFFVAVAVLLSDQISSSLIKPLAERWRPSHEPALDGLLHFVRDYHGGRFGFVSSHAANTFSIALLTSYIFRHKGYATVAFAWAVLCSYSRMYLGVHYLGDILGGTCVGLMVGALCCVLLNKTNQRWFVATPASQSQTATGYEKKDIYAVIAMFALTVVFLIIVSSRIKYI